ncbi:MULTISPECIES: YceI family protein [unclassified Geodermatophilus]|uniref:YceI family protein n=1 Tax=unclassified Geodermatophilus TaxID=2637632 RepID=UPI003EE87F76
MTAQLGSRTPVAGTWTVSDSRTRVTFAARGLGGRLVHGSVSCSSGEVRLDEGGRPVRVRGEVDLESLATGIARRDADLRTPRFLDVARHPTMTWSADRFRPSPDGAWIAEGVLSVRGTTAPLTLVGRPEPVEGGWLRVRAAGTLDRTTVGIRVPALLVGRTVRVAVDAWLRAPSP